MGLVEDNICGGRFKHCNLEFGLNFKDLGQSSKYLHS